MCSKLSDTGNRCDTCKYQKMLDKINGFLDSSKGEDVISLCCVCKGIRAGDVFVKVEEIMQDVFKCLKVNHTICPKCCEEKYNLKHK